MLESTRATTSLKDPNEITLNLCTVNSRGVICLSPSAVVPVTVGSPSAAARVLRNEWTLRSTSALPAPRVVTGLMLSLLLDRDRVCPSIDRPDPGFVTASAVLPSPPRAGLQGRTACAGRRPRPPATPTGAPCRPRER